MAGDLIPPPSPAGRPPKDPVLEPRVSALVGEEPPPAEPPSHAPAPFRGRFGFVLGALAGVAVCAAALAVVLVATSHDSDIVLAENWSAWTPDGGDTLAGAQAIATHVGPLYKRNDGDQLVGVQSQPMAYEGLPIGVAIQPQGGQIELLEGVGLMYVLNGLGPQGMLDGKPSEARGSLLRREALELVLYTFRYLEEVTMVAVMLPPVRARRSAEQRKSEEETTTQETLQQAVFFRPGDLLPQLQVPLHRTLSPRTPQPRTIEDSEAERIDSLTLDNLFVAEYQRAQDGSAYLILQEPEGVE
jgi:hypothetical protein